MGNKNHFESLKPRINPKEFSPYLHIDPHTQEYVPRWHGMTLEFGSRTGKTLNGQISYIAEHSVTIPLLPKVNSIPPPEFSTQERVKIVVNSIFDEMIFPHTKTPSIDLIACSHGTNWGFEPEHSIVANLKNKGFEVVHFNGSPLFPKVGGRNRIQTHGILLMR